MKSVSKQAAVELKVSQGKASLSPYSYLQFFEGLKQHLHCRIEHDYQEQWASVHELDLAKLDNLSTVKEITLTVIDELIFSDLAEKCEFIASGIHCHTNATNQDDLSREQVNEMVTAMLTLAQKFFVDKERKLLNQMDDSPMAKIAKKAGAVALETLNQISFHSKPENIDELTDTPTCLH